MIGYKKAYFFGSLVVVSGLFGPAVASAQMNIQVTNPNTGTVKCLDILNDWDANTQRVVLWDCTGGAGQPSQLWSWLPSGELMSSLVAAPDWNRKCLDVNNNNGADGAQVDIYNCVGGATNEEWRLAGPEASDHGRQLQSVSPGKCLDLNGSQNNFNPWFNGATVDSWTCVNGAWNESWHFADPPSSSAGISVGATDTQTGPDICTSGFGFGGGDLVQVYYATPFFNGFSGGNNTTANSNGSFFLFDTSENGFLEPFCSFQQLQTSVAVTATDFQRNNTQVAYIPSGLFCANGGVSNWGSGCR